MARMPRMLPEPQQRRLLAGVAGPAAFTASWIGATARQHGIGEYSVAREHISGLAAPDARHPRLMTAAFLILGVTTERFGLALGEHLGGRRHAGLGPPLVRLAGAATMAAGLLRRDQMLLGLPPGSERQSWHNNGHDIASGIIYASLIAAPLALAQRFRTDADHVSLRPAAIGTSAVTAGALGLFASRAVEPYNGLVQRFAVTVPALASAALASRLLRAGHRP